MCVQAPACIEGRPVFFSLGNHLFDQKYAETRDGSSRLPHPRRPSAVRRLQHPHWRNHRLPHPRRQKTPPRMQLSQAVLRILVQRAISGVTILPEPWSPDQPVNGIILDGYAAGKRVWQSRRQVWSLCRWSLPWRPNRCCSRSKPSSSIDDEVGLRPYVYRRRTPRLIARWRGSALAWP